MSKTKTKTKKSEPQLPMETNYSIRAGAGCGKTTTLQWCEEGVPKGIKPSDQQEAIFSHLGWDKNFKHKASIRFCCFNNVIQKEAEPKFPHAQVTTNHSLGYQTSLKYLNIKANRYYVDDKKYDKLLKEMIGDPWKDQKLWPIFTTALKLCDMARATLCGNSLVGKSITSTNAHTQAMWEVNQSELIDMANFYGIDIEDGEALKHVESLINQGIRTVREKQDFTDMIFLPNVFGCKPQKVYRCYVDEAQDLNAAQRGLLLGSAEQYVIVGDVFQSIYGFAGADPSSIPNFEKALIASQLPLTITRRCPHSHVEIAKRYLPSDFPFQAAPDAPEGSVEEFRFHPDFYRSILGQANLFLSRTNAPLVAHCFSCWKEEIPAMVRGRNIAANLANVVKRAKADTNESLITELMDDYGAKIEKLIKADKEDQASNKQDELDILIMFATNTNTIKDCIDKLWTMFPKEDAKADNMIQFSTVHKAKGLETDNLGILTPEILPHPGISKIGPFWAQQEKNIAYVCHTRGKDKMFINIKD